LVCWQVLKIQGFWSVTLCRGAHWTERSPTRTATTVLGFFLVGLHDPRIWRHCPRSKSGGPHSYRQGSTGL